MDTTWLQRTRIPQAWDVLASPLRWAAWQVIGPRKVRQFEDLAALLASCGLPDHAATCQRLADRHRSEPGRRGE